MLLESLVVRKWILCGAGLIGVSLGIGCGSETPPANQGSSSLEQESSQDAVGSSSATDPASSNASSSANSSTSSSENTPTSSVGAPSETPAAEPAPPSAGPGDLAVTSPPATAEQLAKWNLSQQLPLKWLAINHQNSLGLITAVAPLPDGKQFLTVGTKLCVQSIDLSEEPKVLVTLPSDGNTRYFSKVVVAPNGEWFAVGDSTGEVSIWSVADFQQLRSQELGSESIVDLAVSPDSAEIATIGFGNEISIWKAEDLSSLNSFAVDDDGLQRVEYSGVNRLVAAAQSSKIWETTTGGIVEPLSEGRYQYSLARSNDGSRMVYADQERLWLRESNGSAEPAPLFGAVATNELIVFSPDHNQLATANGNELRIWDLANQQVIQSIDASSSQITGLAWLPQTKLLVVATQEGRVTLWADATQAAAAGLTELTVPVALPEVGSQQPACSNAIRQIIDLKNLPWLPSSTEAISSLDMVSYSALTSMDEAAAFHRHLLKTQGWSEFAVTSGQANAIEFRKSGLKITVSFSETGTAGIDVNLNLVGNYDLRTAPRFDAAPIETLFEKAATVIYKTQANLLQIETTLLKKFHQAGWTAVARMNSSTNENPDQRDLVFLKGGTVFRVSISRAPVDPDSYTIQYNASLTSNAVPVPSDSGLVEADVTGKPMLVANTAMSLEEAAAFYETQMAAEGWRATEFGRSSSETSKRLSFVSELKQVDMLLVKQESVGTQVRIGNELERSSWQLAPEPTSELEPNDGIEAADFPSLVSASPVVYDTNLESVEIRFTEATLADVAEKYTTALTELGWTREESGIADVDYLLLTFTKGEAELELRGRVQQGDAVLNVQGEGLLWNKPLPTDKPIVSYINWLRTHRHPAGLDLLEQYSAEMEGD